MKFLKTCWVALLELFDTLSSTPRTGRPSLQDPLQPGLEASKDDGQRPIYPPPIFAPPTRGQDPESDFKCDYSNMPGTWFPCSHSMDRGCWLSTPLGQQFNIATDYENTFPIGIVRTYSLRASMLSLNADGVDMPYAKVFDKQYPGPWIQACWGDILDITVYNDLPYNGTTIHWHGLRQLGSLEMDGVNAVTQCPIAPGSSYRYRFRATQYGTSWYHSHYSLQYGDGMAGPITIHGPSSSNYDRAKDPILMTDWNHRSGFQDFQQELLGTPPKMTSILLNGFGSYAGGGNGHGKYNTTFEYGKKYLLRLINTSVDTTFVFAIDRHNITVMTSDFVPISPYVTDHVVVGIGQRYHVVVDATPKLANGSIDTETKQFWMRTIPAINCQNFELGGIPDERQGIVYYGDKRTAYPTTPRGPFSIACRDEDPALLKPVLKWTVPKPAKPDLTPNQGIFEVGIDLSKQGQGRPLPNDTFARWAIGSNTLWLDFSNPTIINLNNKTFRDDYVVIPKERSADSWIYLIITSSKETLGPIGRILVPAAHPIHLHGHDFALLQQANVTFNESLINPNYDNPPRRDVVLLPANGFVVIGFKADNPGAWLLHCHIAWHASSGLGMQILERQSTIAKEMTPERLQPVTEGCKNWTTWFSNPKNYWHPDGGAIAFQDDSGV